VGRSDRLDVLNLLGDELGHSVLEGLGVGRIARSESPGVEGRSDLGRQCLLGTMSGRLQRGDVDIR
jgi:hypothetical protein